MSLTLKDLQKIDPNAKMIIIETKFDPEVKKFLDDLNEAYEKSKNSSIVFK